MLGLHDNGRVLGAQEPTGVIDVGNKIEVLLLHLGDGAGTDHPGVGQHNVQTAEVFHGLRHHVSHTLLVGHIDGDKVGTLAQLSGHLLGQRLVHIGNDHGSAFLIHLLSNAPAKALGRAGDNGDFAGQTAGTCGALVNVLLGQFLPFCHIDHN